MFDVLAHDPVHLLETMTPEKQAQVFRLLLTDVRIKGEGYGPARKHRIVFAKARHGGREFTAA